MASTAKDVNDTIHITVDYRVGICPFNVNKCNVADTLLPHGAVEASFQSAQRTERFAEHDVAGITARICTTLENSGNISNTSFSCIGSSISCNLIRARDENSRTFSARLPESRRRCCKT